MSYPKMKRIRNSTFTYQLLDGDTNFPFPGRGTVTTFDLEKWCWATYCLPHRTAWWLVVGRNRRKPPHGLRVSLIF